MKVTEAEKIIDTLNRFDTIFKTIRKHQEEINEVRATSVAKGYEISKVVFPYEGGILTYWKDHEYPSKGFADEETIKVLDQVKKDIMIFISSVSQIPKYKLPLLVFFRKELYKSFDIAIDSFHRTLRPYLLKDDKYCDFVQEIRKHFTGPEKLKDIVSMILEYDDAYRYRFQDALEDFDEIGFNAEPMAEIRNIFKTLEKRDKSDKLKKKWRQTRKILSLFRFNKKIIQFFEEANIDNMRMSAEDKYHCVKKLSYNWKICQ